MILRRFLLIGIAFSLIASAAPVMGQADIELNFQGVLKDSHGEFMRNESFDFVVKLMNPEAGKTELWKHTSTLSSDENGWISFSIPEISGFLIMDGEFKQTLVIRMEFMPNEQTRWQIPGDNFMITYTLTPKQRDGVVYMKMTRMEGQELTDDIEENLYVFKDEYPFANLQGGFLLTDAPPLDPEAVDDLRLWMLPEVESGATRGAKGAFPQGGYRKR